MRSVSDHGHGCRGGHHAGRKGACQAKVMDCTAMHQALATLASAFVSEPWAEEPKVLKALGKQLAQIREEFHKHVTWAQAPGGLLHTLAEDCPRMCNDIRRLGTEHHHITQYLDELDRALQAFDVAHAATARPVRRAAKVLAETMEQHQSHGHEVVLEVYASDIGVGD